MIIKTSLIPARFDAFTLWPFILVRPGFETDSALMAHERQHLKDQLRCGLIGYYALYQFSWQFRLWAELRGHKEQIKAGGITPERAAELIASEYGIPLTEEEILKRLKV